MQTTFVLFGMKIEQPTLFTFSMISDLYSYQTAKLDWELETKTVLFICSLFYDAFAVI